MNSQKVEPVITQDEYVRYSGGICPACGGWYVEAIEPVSAVKAGYARMPVKCVECLATWEEEYALRGFVSLEGY